MRALNIFMDYFGGHNKNRTVIKMAKYFVERDWFNTVNLIFLVKGYTRSNCDQIMNLFKI